MKLGENVREAVFVIEESGSTGYVLVACTFSRFPRSLLALHVHEYSPLNLIPTLMPGAKIAELLAVYNEEAHEIPAPDWYFSGLLLWRGNVGDEPIRDGFNSYIHSKNLLSTSGRNTLLVDILRPTPGNVRYLLAYTTRNASSL